MTLALVLDGISDKSSEMQGSKDDGRLRTASLDRAIGRIAEAQKLSVQDLRNQMEKDGTPFAEFREQIREAFRVAAQQARPGPLP